MSRHDLWITKNPFSAEESANLQNQRHFSVRFSPPRHKVADARIEHRVVHSVRRSDLRSVPDPKPRAFFLLG